MCGMSFSYQREPHKIFRPRSGKMSEAIIRLVFSCLGGREVGAPSVVVSNGIGDAGGTTQGDYRIEMLGLLGERLSPCS